MPPLDLSTPAEGSTDWADDVNQNFTDIEATVNALGSGTVDPAICNGRLSASSTVAVTTSDTTSATLYFLPRQNAGLTNSGTGGKIALYSGTVWGLHDIGASGVSGSVTSLTTTTTPVYDVFLYDNAGTLTLEFVKWTSNTARATALAIQDGVLVKSGAATRRYLGTIHVVNNSGTISVRDSVGERFVWNFYNRAQVVDQAFESTSGSWTSPNSTTPRAMNANTTGLPWVHKLVVGVADYPVTARVVVTIATTGYLMPNIALDDITVSGSESTASRGTGGGAMADFEARIEGYHYLQATENTNGAGTCSVFGAYATENGYTSMTMFGWR